MKFSYQSKAKQTVTELFMRNIQSICILIQNFRKSASSWFMHCHYHCQLPRSTVSLSMNPQIPGLSIQSIKTRVEKILSRYDWCNKSRSNNIQSIRCTEFIKRVCAGCRVPCAVRVARTSFVYRMEMLFQRLKKYEKSNKSRSKCINNNFSY